MNKLYILGALALANVEASIHTGLTTSIYPLIFILPTQQLAGTYTYTLSADCYSTATATSLGMNNIYHQYYSFSLSKGTSTFGTVALTLAGGIPTITTLISITTLFSGCYHSHLYNWLAQPQVSATTVTAGFGNAAVAYGYAMSGTAVTSCTTVAIVTSTLFKTLIFSGAQFQSSSGTWNSAAAILASINIIPMWGKVGPLNYYAKAATALTYILPTSTGFATASAQNAYWDFMQTNIFQGMTQFGRGGGATTAPCGWWTAYVYENPKAGQTYDVDVINVEHDGSSIVINMWTDNSVVKAASAFVLTALAGLLF